jgi:hypothetical protein
MGSDRMTVANGNGTVYHRGGRAILYGNAIEMLYDDTP